MRCILPAPLAHPVSLPPASMAGMNSSNPDNLDLSRACWRCQHFGHVVAEVHATCTRGPGSLQASPAGGCVYWTAGLDDARPVDWLPVGMRLRASVKVWGEAPAAAPAAPLSWETGRPGRPGDAAEWDRQQVQQAWRATDGLLGRFRVPAAPRLQARPMVRAPAAAARQQRHQGGDDQPAECLA